jgi:NAD(P)-dependent dehydrogenase (short-subunit alcohol dehydrogenase family)
MKACAAAPRVQYGVRVNAVAPGRTRTPILDTVGTHARERMTQMTQWIEQIPMRRLLEADEIAAAVAFIALDGSAVTGQTLWGSKSSLQVMRQHLVRRTDRYNGC